MYYINKIIHYNTYSLRFIYYLYNCIMCSFFLLFLSVSGQLGPTGSESESNLVDSLLYDIRSGFSPNKPFDRDIKVCNKLNIQF